MKLSKVILVNWYLYNPVEIPLIGHTAIVGENGAGKSTIIDAIQTVLFGANQNYIKWDAASSDKKSTRDLKSYCLGYFRPAGEATADARSYRLRDNCESYLALVFERVGSESASSQAQFVNLLLGMEAREAEKKADVTLRGIYCGQEALNLSDFVVPQAEGYQTLSSKLIKQRLELSGLEPEFFESSNKYIEAMANALGPSDYASWIEPTVLRSSLARSVGLKVMDDVSSFVENFILEPKALSVASLVSSQKRYAEILQQIKIAEQKIDALGQIETELTRARDQYHKASAYAWLEAETQVEQMLEAMDEAQSQRVESLQKALQHRVSLLEIRQELRLLEEEIRILGIDIGKDDAQAKIEQLERTIEQHLSEMKQLQTAQDRLQQALLQLMQGDKVALEILDETAVNVLSNLGRLLLDSASQALAAPQAKWQAIDPLIEALFTHIPAMQQRLQQQEQAFFTRKSALETEMQDLQRAVRQAEQGKVQLSPATESLQAALAQAGIEATPVCELVRVQDKRWQPAIEAVLGRNMEALIVAPEDEVAAYRIYRGLQGRVFGASVVKLGQYRQWLNQFERGSAAELIESDSPFALAFMHKMLGRYMLVKTEEELKRHRYAMTQDGMLSTETTVRKNRLSATLKMVQDQALNIRQWQTEGLGLSQTLKTFDQKIQTLRNFVRGLDRLVDFSHSHPTVKLGDYHNQIQDLTLQVAHLTQQKDDIDLTHLSELVDLYDEKRLQARALNKEQSKLATEKALLWRQATELKQKQRQIEQQILPQMEHQRRQAEQSGYFDAMICDQLQQKHESDKSVNFSHLASKAEQKAGEAYHQGQHLLLNYQQQVEDFMTSSALTISVEVLPQLIDLVAAQVAAIEAYNLVPYRQDAEQANVDIERSFRSDVINRLKEAFEFMQIQFQTLNRALSSKQFHGEIYQFHYQPKQEYAGLIDYIHQSTELDGASFNDLFDQIPQSVQQQIALLLEEGQEDLSQIEDYRRYFTYEVMVKNATRGTHVALSKLLRSGSGGEKQSPFYVAIAASLASAWKSLSVTQDGAGLALLDEAFNNLDEGNLQSAVNFMNEVGLQVLVAVPSLKESIFKPIMDTTLFIGKEGQAVNIDVEYLHEDGRNLFIEANPLLNPDLVEKALHSMAESE